LDQVYFNNTVREYAIALGLILGGIIVVYFFKLLIVKRLKSWAEKTPGTWDDFIVESISHFGMPIVQWAIVYWSIHSLHHSENVQRAIEIATSIIVMYYVLRLISSVVTVMIKSGIRRRGHSEDKVRQLGGL